MKQILKYLLFLMIGIIFYILVNSKDNFSVGIPPRDTLQRYVIYNDNTFYLGRTQEEIDMVRRTGIEEGEPSIEHTGGAAGPPEGVPHESLPPERESNCPAEPEPEPEPEREPEPEPCDDGVKFAETPIIWEYMEFNNPTLLRIPPPRETVANPDTATDVRFIPMVHAAGRRLNYRFRADSVIEPSNLDGLIIRERYYDVRPECLIDLNREFNGFVEQLITNRYICRSMTQIYDINTMYYLYRYIDRFINRFNLSRHLDPNILRIFYEYLMPNLRIMYPYVEYPEGIRRILQYLEQQYPNGIYNTQPIIDTDTQVTNILRLIYHINLGFDNMIIVNTLLEGDEPNTREIDIGQLFIMYNYRTGQAVILFHIATDRNIYPNLTIPGNEALQNRLRAAVGTEPFTMNNIHGGWGAGGYMGQALGFCASVFR